jgi:uncharacterized protein
MSRIRKMYEGRFRDLLRGLGAVRIDKGIEWLITRAEEQSRRGNIQRALAYSRVHEELARKAARFSGSRNTPAPSASASNAAPKFLCDVGLGGLARWLRAAGYEAIWNPGVDDAELIRQAQELGAILLTTDSGMMERRLLRDKMVPSLWLPPTISMTEQLRLVVREFRLAVRNSRCMRCGGELRRVNKKELRERIPPRTYLWLDEFFVCQRCDQLFWHGTHWQKIRDELKQIAVDQS